MKQHIIQDFSKWKAVNEDEKRTIGGGLFGPKLKIIPIDDNSFELLAVRQFYEDPKTGKKTQIEMVDDAGDIIPYAWTNLIKIEFLEQPVIAQASSAVARYKANPEAYVWLYETINQVFARERVKFTLRSRSELSDSVPATTEYLKYSEGQRLLKQPGQSGKSTFVSGSDQSTVSGGTVSGGSSGSGGKGGAITLSRNVPLTNLSSYAAGSPMFNFTKNLVIKMLGMSQFKSDAKVLDVLNKAKADLKAGSLGANVQSLFRGLSGGYGIIDEYGDKETDNLTPALIKKLSPVVAQNSSREYYLGLDGRTLFEAAILPNDTDPLADPAAGTGTATSGNTSTTNTKTTTTTDPNAKATDLTGSGTNTAGSTTATPFVGDGFNLKAFKDALGIVVGSGITVPAGGIAKGVKDNADLKKIQKYMIDVFTADGLDNEKNAQVKRVWTAFKKTGPDGSYGNGTRDMVALIQDYLMSDAQSVTSLNLTTKFSYNPEKITQSFLDAIAEYADKKKITVKNEGRISFVKGSSLNEWGDYAPSSRVSGGKQSSSGSGGGANVKKETVSASGIPASWNAAAVKCIQTKKNVQNQLGKPTHTPEEIKADPKAMVGWKFATTSFKDTGNPKPLIFYTDFTVSHTSHNEPIKDDELKVIKWTCDTVEPMLKAKNKVDLIKVAGGAAHRVADVTDNNLIGVVDEIVDLIDGWSSQADIDAVVSKINSYKNKWASYDDAETETEKIVPAIERIMYLYYIDEKTSLISDLEEEARHTATFDTDARTRLDNVIKLLKKHQSK